MILAGLLELCKNFILKFSQKKSVENDVIFAKPLCGECKSRHFVNLFGQVLFYSFVGGGRRIFLQHESLENKQGGFPGESSEIIKKMIPRWPRKHSTGNAAIEAAIWYLRIA
uniref:(northern house mosquito) hypothetical protein n=1 Tax=Culex pipiens TaxID=7175 RepID=A0A8D8EZZ9_CULPI